MEKLGEPMTYQLENDEKHVVDNEGPFATITIGCDTEQDGANRPEHQHQSNAPSDVSIVFSERLGEFADSQRHCKEIKSVPRLRRVSAVRPGDCRRKF